MGYYSDVALLISKSEFDKFKNQVKNTYQDFNLKSPDSVFNIFKYSNVKLEINEQFFYFTWVGYKWNFNDEIKCIESNLEKLNDLMYKFIRCGEDINDNEELGNCYPINLYLKRKFEIYPDNNEDVIMKIPSTSNIFLEN